MGVPQSIHRAVWVCIQLCHCWPGMLLTEMAGLPGQFLDVFCPGRSVLPETDTQGKSCHNTKRIVFRSSIIPIFGDFVRSREYKPFLGLHLCEEETHWHQIMTEMKQLEKKRSINPRKQPFERPQDFLWGAYPVYQSPVAPSKNFHTKKNHPINLSRHLKKKKRGCFPVVFLRGNPILIL